MEPHKLRIKVGEHEFEAEGSAQEVTAQFEAWKELVASIPKGQNGSVSGVPSKTPGKVLEAVTEIRTRDGFAAPWDIFEVDDRRKLISLKMHPSGEDRDANALLLLLFAYKKVESKDEVAVTKLIESMQVSGLKPGRIDRTLASFLDQGLLLKAGRAKGSKYRLTNTGYVRAEEMAREIFAKAYIEP